MRYRGKSVKSIKRAGKLSLFYHETFIMLFLKCSHLSTSQTLHLSFIHTRTAQFIVYQYYVIYYLYLLRTLLILSENKPASSTENRLKHNPFLLQKHLHNFLLCAEFNILGKK